MPHQHREQGFTLIEVLVASSLAIGLSIVIMTLAIQAQQMATVMISKSQLNAEARLIFDMLGTGKTVDGSGTTGIETVGIIDDSDRIPGLREGSGVGMSTSSTSYVLSSINGAIANPSGAVTSQTTKISVSKDETQADSTDNRLVISYVNGSDRTRMSSAISRNGQSISCRAAGQIPTNPLAGEPYYDCPNATAALVVYGYVSHLKVDTSRPINNKTVDVGYTLVDPRLAGWRDQNYTKWDYRETYRTSFLMNTTN
ncbi:hypothetical protein CCP3SC1_60054 [Gammaproteobacteria bacterium]